MLALALETLCHRLAELMRIDAEEELKLGSLNALMAYLSFDMSGFQTERFRVLFLDNGRDLIADHEMWSGTVNKVQVHPREVVRQALAETASSIIVVHNHVTGDLRPSVQDIEMTRALLFACMACEIEIADHLIVNRLGAYSMRAAGTLQELESDWHSISSNRKQSP